MDTSIRRTAIWVVLAALSITAAGWMAMGASANVGAPPVGTTGELKIVKNLGGGWPDGAFIFTWSCDDGQNGSATFPDDFTGANYTTPQQYPLGTVCTVEETNGVLSVSDYNVTTHIESSAGFQAINPRDVPIDNSQGQNVIQYMNDPIDPKQIKITKNVVGGPLSVSDFEFEIFCNMGAYQKTVFVPGPGNSGVFDVPGTLTDCKVTEKPAAEYATTGDSGVIKQLNADAPTEWVITNTFIEPEPEVGSLKIIKQPIPGNAPGPWKFTWSCDDEAATSGTATYPADFTGANYDVPAKILLGTKCTVTETFPNGDAASWSTTFQVEGGPFTAGTVAVVPIDNAQGANTVKFKNTFIEPEPKDARVTLTKVGPPLGFGFAISCDDGTSSGFALQGGSSTAWTFSFKSNDGTVGCHIVEESLTGWTTTVTVAGADSSKTIGVDAGFVFGPGDAVSVTFTNVADYLSTPPTGKPPVVNQ